MNAQIIKGRIEDEIGIKVLWRLVLPAALFLLLGSIDRSNVGFAALEMNEALGLSASQYGFGAGVLFVGYLLAKYPSVMLYEKLGIRNWLALIAVCWGICATCMAFIQTPIHYYIFRFLIGLSEAGLASGLYLYLSHWASDKYKATVLAFPIAAIPLSQVIGAPLSGFLMSMDNPIGMEGWRWMYLVEGVPALALAVFAYFYFPSRPKDAKWLSESQRQWASENIDGAKSAKEAEANRWAGLKNPLTWVCAAIWFCLLAGNYGVIFWLPQIIKNSTDLSTAQIGMVVALPWLGSVFGLILNARHSDKTGERYLHIGVPCLIAGAGLVSAYYIGQGPLALILLIIGGSFLGSTVAPFWAIPPKLLRPEELSIGVVAIHMTGSFAGMTIPVLIGRLRDEFSSFAAPIYMIALIMVIAFSLCLWAKKLEAKYA